MKFWFKGQIEDLKDGIEIICKELSFEISPDGVPVQVKRRTGNIEIELKDGKGIITCERKIHFFRALGLFIEEIQQNDYFKICEEPQFTINGAMFDVSRNTVMSVDSIKKMILKMAVMGLDMIMLYTEDTYTIEGQPYFGYMRGRYTHEELKKCDDYAYIFGIEMIPCIQTLAHLTQFLKWDAVADLRDDVDILLAGSEKTYQFIEAMIKAASAPFRSKRIHIGMDEAHGLGLGNYLKINGYKRRFDIMNDHLKKVLNITYRFRLKPMIWSDMYFRLGSKTGDYYDLNADIPEDVVSDIPEGLQLVYWDYYHDEEYFYRDFIKMHKRFGSIPVFAGGIWTWFGFGVNYGKTFVDTNAALDACKKEGVKEVFTTVWMNNGSVNNHFASLLGLQLFAEHGYAGKLDTNKLKKRFEFCTRANYDAFMDLKYLDETPGTNSDNLDHYNPSKYLLWQDILIGLFDKHVEGLDMEGHYKRLKETMEKYEAQNKEWACIFEVAKKLCSVLETKSCLGLKIKKYYDKNNISELKRVIRIYLPELAKKVHDLRAAHRNQWFKTYKAFGWEVADINYGALLMRIDTAIQRLTDYIYGRIERIEELEEDRLYFNGKERPKGTQIGRCNEFNRIITANATQF